MPDREHRPPEERTCLCCGALTGPYNPLDERGLCGDPFCADVKTPPESFPVRPRSQDRTHLGAEGTPTVKERPTSKGHDGKPETSQPTNTVLDGAGSAFPLGRESTFPPSDDPTVLTIVGTWESTMDAQCACAKCWPGGIAQGDDRIACCKEELNGR